MRPCDRVIEAMLHIQDKKTNETVPFYLNEVQKWYTENSTPRDIILKSRRLGFSSYILAEFLVACLATDNTSAVVISHETEATQRHLQRVRFYKDTIKGPPPQMGFDSKNMMTFPKRHSTFYIGTAGSKTFGRGDTITHLHCTEYAFWEVTREHTAGLFQAASFAKRIVIECTANGFNHFYRMVQQSQQGGGDYRLHFYGWYQDPYSYRDVPPDFQFSDDDKSYFDSLELGLNMSVPLPQRYWYIKKRQEFMQSEDDVEGMLLMKQEYPSTIDEAFVSTGSKVFRRINYVELKPARIDGRLKIWHEPVDDKRYVIGADVGGGTGLDFSVIKIIRADTLEEVASYRDNWINPSEFAYKLIDLGRMYNAAYLVPEANNHGILTVEMLNKSEYPRHLIYQRTVPDAKSPNKKRKVLGFLGSAKSVIYSLETLKMYINKGLVIHDTDGYDELRALEQTDTGNYEAPSGMHDDCAKSYGHACVGLRRLETYMTEEKKTEEEKPGLPSNVIMFPWGTTIEQARKFAIRRRI